jgi:hypothetical protein
MQRRSVFLTAQQLSVFEARLFDKFIFIMPSYTNKEQRQHYDLQISFYSGISMAQPVHISASMKNIPMQTSVLYCGIMWYCRK